MVWVLISRSNYLQFYMTPKKLKRGDLVIAYDNEDEDLSNYSPVIFLAEIPGAHEPFITVDSFPEDETAFNNWDHFDTETYTFVKRFAPVSISIEEANKKLGQMFVIDPTL